jgi:phosphatidylglycerol:prolipoprotein diacylglycerol transferase
MIWSIRPEIFSFSPVPRWYSICFAIGIISGHAIARRLISQEKINDEEFNKGFLYVIIGTMVGMRLGHCLFYQPEYFFEKPWEILMIWQGGYASHGGFAGVVIAVYLFLRKHPELDLLWLLDRVAVGCVCVAGWIRIGNFFNSEMIGRESTASWAVTFSLVDQIPRHPTQLYEAIGYFLICICGWLLVKRTSLSNVKGRVLGFVVLLTASWRIFCEFFKIEQVNFERGMFLNMGQILSIPFLLIGLWLWFRSSGIATDEANAQPSIKRRESKILKKK